MILPWVTDGGSAKKCRMKVGDVGRTLISVSKLSESGYDAILTHWRPRLVNRKTGEIIPLLRVGGMYILRMWVWVPRAEESGFPGQP